MFIFVEIWITCFSIRGFHVCCLSFQLLDFPTKLSILALIRIWWIVRTSDTESLFRHAKWFLCWLSIWFVIWQIWLFARTKSQIKLIGINKFFSGIVIRSGDLWIKFGRQFSRFIWWLYLPCDLIHSVVLVFLLIKNYLKRLACFCTHLVVNISKKDWNSINYKESFIFFVLNCVFILIPYIENKSK